MATKVAEVEQAAPQTDQTRPTRIAKLVSWSVRLTSIPVFALVMASLLPALATFNVSANDDKIIALGLCGVCFGLVLGWRWAGVGGGLVVAGTGLMLSQGDSLLSPDPFCVAFGLQGLLFLISWLLTSQKLHAGVAAGPWLRRAAITVLAICAAAGAGVIVRGPGPTLVPKEKEPFIGIWQNGSGLTMEIIADGHAKISEDKDSKIDPCNNPLPRNEMGSFLAYFRPDEKLELTTGPFGDSKIYHIDRPPHAEGKQIKMVLNGSDPYQRTRGMVLVKKPAP